LAASGSRSPGRSFRLRINYRTTYEILSWGLTLLTAEVFDDLDAGKDTLAGYRSETHGESPLVEGFATRAEKMAALSKAVKACIDQGIKPD
jgi:hypothetical protein